MTDLTASAPMTVISTQELTQLRDSWADEGQRVAFVPTMGALHEGHLSLVLQARAVADRVIVSIFVNPMQFGPNEDFSRYPRTLKEDLNALAPLGVDAVFLPSAASMYPEGFQTTVMNKSMAAGLCGASRPGHFDGVLTVVLKLLNLVRPHIAIFGKKDYQQWRLIERMAQDLNLNTSIVGAETQRDPDGLAKSSRNRYLSAPERATALKLSQGLLAVQTAFKGGERQKSALLEAFQQVVTGADLKLEYSELRRQRDLAEVEDIVTDPVVMMVAARVGTTRLIDNMEMT